ncbi:MAG: exodeoxyribonuclease VII small subunit [Muribaculaceae bacterium]|nr:exodeoxyribonuclease VII small subunit [Muribaculaceae bacterium]MBQ6278885.1 exodeoxyribonuclease VII small subunit [Muribaculaceae bacterium]MBR0023696.1 exodeoxyribonuclease VII small subunit [Muribaculaceae bacterium]
MEPQDITKMTYTQAITELEEIVKKMQSPECSIDNLSQYTARSLELLKVCKAKLTATDEELKKVLNEMSDDKSIQN